MVSKDERMPARIGALSLVGGNPALDFANTVSWRGADPADDRLLEPEDVAWWGVHAGLLDPAEVGAVGSRAGDRERFREAVALRETIHDVFAALAEGEPPSPDALERLSHAWAGAQGLRRLVAGPGGVRAELASDDPLRRLLARLALEAGDLLLDGDPARMKACAGDECGYLYVDLSRNRSRRWCDMAECGNRAKVRRFRAREGEA